MGYPIFKESNQNSWIVNVFQGYLLIFCKIYSGFLLMTKSTHLSSILIMLLLGCENNVLNSETEFPVFELAGRAAWQLQHEDGQAVARVMLDMYAYCDGIVEDVWFHGKVMDGVTYELISQDSVYIGHFVERADSNFSIYRQDGYANRPEYPKWSMWVAHL